MKKILLVSFLAACVTTSISAQITRTTTTTTKTDSLKMETLKTAPENTIVKRQADLRITALSFAHVSTTLVNGVTTHTYEIRYTIKNDGNLAVPANSVLLQGFIFRTGQPTAGACGRVASTLGETINPGATMSGTFRCTHAFDKNNPPTYRLIVDYDNNFKESNEDNNMVQSTLIF